MVEVLADMAGRLDVDTEPMPTGGQSVVDPVDHALGVGLIAHRLESRDQVIGLLARQFRGVLGYELGIGQAQRFGFPATGCQCLFGEVHPDELGVRKGCGHHIDGVAAAGTDVCSVIPD
jgi:hypothetical protein